MLAALTIVAGFVFPLILFLVAAALTLAALQRHLTVRQLLLTTLVLTTGIAAVTMMFGSLAEHHSIAVWPLLIIIATVVFSFIQFGAALLLGAIARLRRLAVQ